MINNRQSKVVSRVELLLWLQYAGRSLENSDSIAKHIGYEWQVNSLLEKKPIALPFIDEAKEPSKIIEKERADQTIDVQIEDNDIQANNNRYLQVVKREQIHFADEPLSIQGIDDFTKEDLQPSSTLTFDLKPLIRWERLWPVLKRNLSVKSENNVDLRKMINYIAYGKVINQLPRSSLPQWAENILLILDFNNRVLPFWDDMLKVKKSLLKMRGERSVRVVEYTKTDEVIPNNKTAVLILSDLGMLQEANIERKHWLRLGREFNEANITPFVLTPVSSYHIDFKLSCYYHIVLWDRNSRLLRQQHGDVIDNRAQLEQLVTLLSPAIRIEPELLRAVRYLLLDPRFDTGIEAQFWQHSAIEVSPLACALKSSQIENYRSKFKTQSPELQKAIIRLIRQNHAHLFPAIMHHETLIWASLVSDDVVYEFKEVINQAELFLRKTAKMLYQNRSDLDDAKKAYAKRVLDKSHNDLLKKYLSFSVFEGVVNVDKLKQGTKLKSGIDLQELQRTLFASEHNTQEYVLSQYKNNLFLSRKDYKFLGFFIANYIVANNNVFIQIEMLDGKVKQYSCFIDLKTIESTSINVPLECAIQDIHLLILQSSNEKLTLKCFSKIFLTDRLPIVKGEFFGRKAELKLIENAWNSKQVNIIQFVATGGTGKTKLIKYWLDNQFDNGVAIAWSFYSQGAEDDKISTASSFFSHALKLLGSSRTTFINDEEKGEHLAELLQKQRTLLILDGLETLQYLAHDKRGELKDRALRQFLKILALKNNGLCIITTRIAVNELQNRKNIILRDLHNLTISDGTALLRSLQVTGSTRELEKAVKEYGCHALALHLLGNALHTYFAGDIKQRHNIKALLDHYDEDGRHAFRIMQAYKTWLAGTTDLQVLYLLGLFDHPIEVDVLNFLVDTQINNLTAHIDKRAWQVAIKDLQDKHHILSVHEENKNLLDCHPLIREYFGQQLQSSLPEAWQFAHKVLYEYYARLPVKKLPDTVKEMQPLFQAIEHGCKAGLHQQVFDTIYYPRISREKTYYLSKIGACADDLAILTHFFESYWTIPQKNLRLNTQGLVLRTVAHRLRALGWIKQSIEPFNAAIAVWKQLGDAKEVAITESNLIEPHLTLGNIQIALRLAESGVENSYHADSKLERRLDRVSVYARALHQAGKKENAYFYFKEAEKIQQKYKPEINYLLGISGFRYSELLLEDGKFEEAIAHAKESLEIEKAKAPNPLFIGLSHLILGRVYLCQRKNTEAKKWLNPSLEYLREANNQDHLPRILLIFSNLHRYEGQYKQAHDYLAEVLEIAEPNGMRLHLNDYHLEMARLLIAKGKPLEAEKHVEIAAGMIQEMGYHRRDKELNELKARLTLPPFNSTV